MDGGASSPATATPSEKDTISCGNHFDWKFERLRPSRAHPEADGTDSPPHHPFSDSAEILRISGRGICKEAIFSPGASPHSEEISARGRPTEIFDFAWSVAKRLACPLGKQPFRRAGRRPRLEVERVHTFSSSPGLFWRKYWFSTMQVVLLGTLFPTTRAWGAPLPYSRRGARGLRPSRALPGLFWRRYWFPTMQVVLWGTLFPTGQAILLMALFSTTRA